MENRLVVAKDWGWYVCVCVWGGNDYKKTT